MVQELNAYFNGGQSDSLPSQEQPPKKELTTRELADSWLDFREKEVSDRMAEVEHPKSKATPTKLTPPGPMPDIYRGSGMDESDWKVAQLEYEQAEAEEEYGGYEDEYWDSSPELDYLWDELSNIREARQAVKEGDNFLELELANREKARLQALDEKRRIEEEAKNGVELEQTENIIQTLDEAITLMSEADFPIGEAGSNNWELTNHFPEEKTDDGQIKSPEQFIVRQIPNHDDPVRNLHIRIRPQADDSYELTFEDFREAESVEKYGKSGHKGVKVRAVLKGNRAYHTQTEGVIQTYQYGYPMQSSVESSRPANESDFSVIKTATDSLLTDIKELSAK